MSEEFEWSSDENLQNEAEDFPAEQINEPIAAQADEPAAEQPAPHAEKPSPYANSPFASSPFAAPVIPETPRKAAKEPRKKKGGAGKVFKGIFCTVLAAAVVGGACFFTAVQVSNDYNRRLSIMNEQIHALENRLEEVSAPVLAPSHAASGEALTPAQVYEQNVDKVVAISSKVRSTVLGRVTEGTSTGSGFILTEDGYVVTNFHVVENSTAITVLAHDGREFSAELIGKDSTNDVALLKVEAQGLPAVTLGSSSTLFIGDMVAAIGNPLGNLSATQTVGYISGKDRQVTTDNTIINMLQTDASINSGNSGGPLFNMYGEVVGITTAKYSGTTTSGASIEGIGFAIPIDDVKPILTDLKDLGYVSSGYMGVIVQNVDSKTASMYNLPNGAYVSSITEGGSADRAGIQEKDIITKLGSTAISNITDLTRALRGFKAGDETTVTVFRSGSELVLSITLDEKPREEETEHEGAPSEGSYDEWFDYFNKFFGVTP